MNIRPLVVAVIFGLWALPATAQPLFANPLGTPSGYRAARGEMPNATHRFRYEVTETLQDQTPVVTEATIEAGADWALYREGDLVLLYDFRLNRQFQIKSDTFTTTNGMADVVFRVMERQNHVGLQAMLSKVDATKSMMTDCDSDSELGLSLPGYSGKTSIAFADRQGFMALSCDGKDVGGFTAGKGAVPAAFWPTMFRTMTVHPALFKRVHESGAAPQVLEVARGATGHSRKSVFKLLAVEDVETPYPLTDMLRNATAEMFDTLLGPGGGQLASDVVAARAQGGPPTLKSWSDHIAALAQSSEADAAMLVIPSSNMFPELDAMCSGRGNPICAIMHRIGPMEATNPAPMALLKMGMAEQAGNTSEVIRLMQVIAKSPQRDHPAAGASFALALPKFSKADIEKAKAAGLATDVVSLQANALKSLPYNPAYWTDAGDTHVHAYNWGSATLLYDIAFTLPMPSAVASNGVLIAKRQFFEKIRNDFPDAFLQR